jgi:hypothetical protein
VVIAVGFAATARADGASPPAKTGEKTSSLSWTRQGGADGCIGTHDLAQRVEAILHRGAIVSAAAADLSIEGHAETKSPKGYRAVIVVADGRGERLGKRELVTDDADCRALDEPVSLAIALMIDPDALTRPPPDHVDPPPPPPPDPKIIVKEKTVYVPVEKPAPDKPSKPYRFEGYLGGVTGLGATPIGGGAIAGAMLDPPWFGAFEATLSLIESTKSFPSSESRMQFWRLEGSAYFCPLAGNLGLFQGSLGAGGQAGFVASSSNGPDAQKERVDPLVNVAIRGRAGLWIHPITITLGATFSVPILRATYSYTSALDGSRVLFEAAPVGGTFDLSIGVKLPEPTK